jgi:hypothetical protein
LRVLSLGSCATVKKHPLRLAVPPRHEEFQARGDEEPTRALADNVRKGSILLKKSEVALELFL